VSGAPDPKPRRIVVASANPDKAAEIAEILAVELAGFGGFAGTALPGGTSALPGGTSALPGILVVPRPSDLEDVDETGETLAENAALKARAVGIATGLDALADDSGLEVDALGGAPGVRSARYAGEPPSYSANVAKLLAALSAHSHAADSHAADSHAAPSHAAPEATHAPAHRTARFRTVAMWRAPDGYEVVCEGVVEGVIAEEPRGSRGFGYDPVFVPIEGDGRTFAEMTSSEKHALSARGRAFAALAARLRAELASH